MDSKAASTPLSMDSEAASTTLPPTEANPTPVVPAPLSTLEGSDATPAAASSPSSTSSFASMHECFLCDEDEAGFETASERSFAPEPDEEAVLDDEVAETDDTLSCPNGDQAPPPDVVPEELITMPKARLPEDGDEVADAEGTSPPPDPDLVGGADGALEENGRDDHDKGPVAAGGTVSEGVGGGVEAENPDGTQGGDADTKVNPDELLSEVKDEETLPESPVGDEVRKDGVSEGYLVVDAAASTELSNSMGSGDGDVAGEDRDAGSVGGSGEGAVTDVVTLQSGVGVISEAEEKRDFDEEPEWEEDLGSVSGDEKRGVAQVSVELKPEKESEDALEENAAQRGASSDDLEVLSTVPTVENQGLKPSEAKEKSGDAQEEEEQASDLLKKTENFGDANEGVPAVVDVSLESGEDEYSAGKLNDSDTTEVVHEIVPSEPKGEADGMQQATVESQVDSEDTTEAVDKIFPSEPRVEEDGIEQASAEPQVISKEVECVLDANDADMSPVRETQSQSLLSEDSKHKQAGSSDNEVPMVAGSQIATVTPVADSDMKHIDDGFEAAAGEEYMDLDEVGVEEEDEEEEVKESLIFDEPAKVRILGSSETARRLIKELDGGSSGASSGFGSSRDYANQIDGLVVSDSDEDVETDADGEGKELFDSAALAALLKAAAGASADGTVTISAPDATRTLSVDRPAGLGSSVSSLRQGPARTMRPNIVSPSDLATAGEEENNMDEEDKKLQEKVEQIRVKFLRLLHRLGHSPEDRVAAQVLFRVDLAEGIRRGRQIGRVFSLENAKKKALQLEEDGKEPLNFSCNILVLGKTGVGKSATINSIFGEEKVHTNAFEPATSSVKEIIGIVDGIKICISDTPGLRASVMDQTASKRILSTIKKYMKKCPPDIVLYVDRLDTQTWHFNDLPLLRSITSILGSSIWFNAVVALTHAASASPDGPSGSPLSYDAFIDQRSRIVQHAIRQAAGDMRLMNPVALIENHPSCRKNREGERVLPNGLNWRTQTLLLCYSSKILSEANSLLKLQDPSPGKLFGFHVRSPPLPFLLPSLLQSRAHPKLATDNGVASCDSDIELGDLSDSDQEEEEDEYDQLPPFKPLREAQIAKLTKEQRKAYFDEYDYCVKLLLKKQWKEEIRRLKEIKKTGKVDRDESGYGDMADDYDADGAPAAVPVPLPDMVLPPSFDCDNPAYRYRFLEPTSQLLARPVLDTHGWDHDCGYDGISLEENLPIAGQYPAVFSVQITKDKKDFSIHLVSSISAKHVANGSTLAGFDIQSVGKQLAYILRGEAKFKNRKKNKTAAGVAITFLGENIATGLKVEDQLFIGKRLGLVASTGAVRAQGDVAYGANMEVRLQDKDFPIGQEVSTLGLSLMRWSGHLALGANLQSQFSVGRNSKMAVRVGLNNKNSGQITIRTSTSEQLHIALLGILPLAVSIYRSFWSGESY